MAKAYSKAAKLKLKKAMPKLADTPRRERNGRRSRSIYNEDPAEQVLRARARQMGERDKRHMRNPALSEPAGQAIYSIREGDAAKDLWDTYAAFTAAEARYMKHFTGLSLYAKTARIEMAPERFETRADEKPDLRSEDEKHRDAVNRFMEWRGYVMHLPTYQQQLIFDAAYNRAPVMDAGKITTHGKRFVEAMERLAEVVAEKK